jgi:hypothetical protein
MSVQQRLATKILRHDFVSALVRERGMEVELHNAKGHIPLPADMLDHCELVSAVARFGLTPKDVLIFHQPLREWFARAGDESQLQAIICQLSASTVACIRKCVALLVTSAVTEEHIRMILNLVCCAQKHHDLTKAIHTVCSWGSTQQQCRMLFWRCAEGMLFPTGLDAQRHTAVEEGDLRVVMLAARSEAIDGLCRWSKDAKAAPTPSTKNVTNENPRSVHAFLRGVMAALDVPLDEDTVSLVPPQFKDVVPCFAGQGWLTREQFWASIL